MLKSFNSLIDDSEVSSKIYIIAFLAIFLVALLNFSNVVSGNFVADDMPYIVENEIIHTLFNPDILFSKEHLSRGFVKFNNYRPIYFFALSLEYYLFGLDPFPYHLINIFLHTINSFLLYYLTLKYTNKKILAILSTLIFVVHPIHTEAVSNIIGLSELLTAFFLLLAIWSYSNSKTLNFYYFFSLICYLFGIMSKESGVVLPGIIILLDVCSSSLNSNNFKSKLFYYIGYLLTFLGYLALKISIRGSIVNSKQLVFTEGNVLERIYTMSLVFLEYFRLLIWPNKLVAFYDIFLIPIVKTPTFQVVSALSLILALLFTGLILIKYEKITAFSILFFFGTMSVVSNIFFDLGVIMAERFLYFPSISICLLFGLGLYYLINKGNTLKLVGVSLSFFIICSMTVRTYFRNLDWLTQDSVREAFLRDAPSSPRNAVMQQDKIVQLFDKGQVNEAIELAQKIVRDYPNYALAHHKLGKMLQSIGKDKEALEYFRNASNLRPDNLEMRISYALSLLNTGALSEAKIELETIIQINPNLAETHNYLGIIYLNLGLYPQAKSEFQKSLSLDPNYKAAETNLFKLYQFTKDNK